MSRRSKLTIGAAALIALAMCIYACVIFPRLAAGGHVVRFAHAAESNEKGIAVMKALLALAALGVLSAESAFRSLARAAGGAARSPAALRRLAALGRPEFVRRALVVLAALGAFAYFDFGNLGFQGFYHRHDTYHYYVGAKYNRELGYTRLYLCAAIAQAEISPSEATEVRRRRWRDLATNTILGGDAALLRADECKREFNTKRWEGFKKDALHFFRASNRKYWNDMQVDHGYNPPPLWTLLGGAVASVVPTSDDAMRALGCIDLVLFVGTFTALLLGFGARVTCIALVFWGAQIPANMFFTGGAFLRQDWLFFLVLSVVLARKRRPFSAGMSLGISALLRIFPVFFAAGWGVVLCAGWWKQRRIHRGAARALAGLATCAALLVPVTVAVYGPRSWTGFVQHIRVHAETPLTNHMGLRTLISYSGDGRMAKTRDNRLVDPFEKWKAKRHSNFESRKGWYWLVCLLSGVMFVCACWQRRLLWIAEALGVFLVCAWTELTCYYYSFFLVALPLSRLGRSFEQSFLVLAAASPLLLLSDRISYWWDERYEAQALLFFGYAALLVVSFLPEKKAPKETKPASLVIS